ncbi:MAG: esterase/lipase superfamily enzyme [Planctomycetota bacterium]|jgi:esterase/lipase superfamily enzyme
MTRVKSSWHSERLDREVNIVRWGEVGTPVLFFSTAAGDCEECERFLMVEALDELITAGRIKLYSVDSVPGQVWLQESNDAVPAAKAQNAFDGYLYNELVPAIRKDCDSEDIQIIAAGPSIGAFEALAAVCRHPDVFSHAICMSGTYGLEKFIEGSLNRDWYDSSPLHFLPDLEEDGAHLKQLRERSIVITHGEGRWEDPEESWKVARALGERDIPNRVVPWGEEWDHDWPTWRKMLPLYLEEYLSAQ